MFEAVPSAKTRGTCILLNGQTEFIEKYFEVIDELRARGFTVATMDWRGQGESACAVADRLKVHVADFSEYDDDLATLIEAATSRFGDRPLVGLAHSMGGHNLVRTLHARPRLFRCAVLSAPMIAISTRGTPAWLARAATALHVAGGASSSWVWGMAGRDPAQTAFEDQVVTSDPARFRRTQALLAKNPDVRRSGPTWGWLEAAYRSMRTMNAPGYAEAITTPVLVCGAGRDRIVLTSSVRSFALRMPHGEYVEFEDAEHEILMENDAIRARFWSAFDAFAAKFV